MWACQSARSCFLLLMLARCALSRMPSLRHCAHTGMPNLAVAESVERSLALSAERQCTSCAHYLACCRLWGCFLQDRAGHRWRLRGRGRRASPVGEYGRREAAQTILEGAVRARYRPRSGRYVISRGRVLRRGVETAACPLPLCPLSHSIYQYLITLPVAVNGLQPATPAMALGVDLKKHRENSALPLATG